MIICHAFYGRGHTVKMPAEGKYDMKYMGLIVSYIGLSTPIHNTKILNFMMEGPCILE
jgi:hypothetical protein